LLGVASVGKFLYSSFIIHPHTPSVVRELITNINSIRLQRVE
jgi:hypothetical protein